MNKRVNQYLYYICIVLILLLVQQLASKIGGLVANLFSYQRIDSHNLFVSISVHHIMILIIALLIIYITKNLYDIHYGFNLGKVEVGCKYVTVFSIIILIYMVLNYLIGYHFGFINPTSFPFNMKNILGMLSFQLFLSGPAEEILFRAIPISILLFISKRSKIIKWGISLEIIIAALLFSAAHIQWSFSPWTITFDYYQLIYSFILGIAYGKAYQASKSILYPILMHSISNIIYVGIGYLFVIIL